MSTILVTGVGGGVGQSIVKCFAGSPYHVIGVDADHLAAGMYAVSRSYLVPPATHADYVASLIDIGRREHCDLLFPGLDYELPRLAQAANEFRAAGMTVVVSSPEVVATADDKLATHQFLKGHGFDAPGTLPLSRGVCAELGLPMVLKPRVGGSRSQGVHIVTDQAGLDRLLDTLPQDAYIAQAYLAGDEYTCSSVTIDGECFGTIVMRRVLRDGDTYKAFISDDPRIHDYVRAVAEALQPFGACNFQLRMREGRPAIFEINARCSGTTYARALAGFNEPVAIADCLIHGTRPRFAVRNLTILRYWQELAVEPARVDQLRAAGWLAGDGSAL